MTMLTQVLFLIGCAITALAVAATLALSPSPRSIVTHTLGFARITVFAGAAFGAAKCLETKVVAAELLPLLFGTAVIYAIQARLEAERQRRRHRDSGTWR